MTLRGTAFIVLNLLPALAECDLEVRVFDPLMRPASIPALVRFEDEGREAIQPESFKGNVSRFCDLGLREFSVTVGHDGCGQVRISRLRAGVRTLVLPVVYENCHSFGIHSGCELLIRLRTATGERLAGARVRAGQVELTADELGRIRTNVPAGREGFTLAIGSTEKRVVVQCTGSRPVELIVEFPTAPKIIKAR